MFNEGFYPTPHHVIAKMWDKVKNKDQITHILEPSAGKGDIADFFKNRGHRYQIDCIEIEPDLVAILNDKGYPVVGFDWLTYDGVCYYSLIMMNPPFSNGDDHLLKAYDFMHSGEIVCLLNAETILNPYSESRKRLKILIERHGHYELLGDVFAKGAERKTGVNVALVYLKKESQDDTVDLWKRDGGEETKIDTDIDDKNMLAIVDNLGNMQHFYDEANQHMAKALQHIRKANIFMNANGIGMYSSDYEKILSLAAKNVNEAKAEFFKKHRNDAWVNVFEKMEFRKWLDKKQKDEFLRDIKTNAQIPFTKANIRGTLENVFLARNKLFEKSVANVFDELTRFYDGNTNHKEGWKTNSNYKVNQKLIFPYGCTFDERSRYFHHCYHGSKIDIYNDIDRILCVLSGKEFEECHTVYRAMDNTFRNLGWGVKSPFDSECESEFFNIRFFMKGTVHLSFKNKDLWAKFNKTAAAGKMWLGQD